MRSFFILFVGLAVTLDSSTLAQAA
ncbi:uncharacterized protein METZ01_LOCUS467779, partial [marine metagenome]